MKRLKIYCALFRYRDTQGDIVTQPIWLVAYSLAEAKKFYSEAVTYKIFHPPIDWKFIDIVEGLYRWDFENKELVAMNTKTISTERRQSMYMRLKEMATS